MTTARSLALSLSIGGVVASSLPTSTSRVSKELDRLRDNATDSRNEMRRLQARLRGLDRDTQEYQDTLEEVNRLRGGLANTGQEIRDLSVRQRELSARSRTTRESFAALTAAAALVTGAVVATGAAIGAVSSRIRDLNVVAATTGASIGGLEQDTRILSVALGDPQLASAAIAQLAELKSRAKSFDLSVLGAAAAAGLDTEVLREGNLKLENIHHTLARINQEGDDFARRNLVEALGPDLLAAAAAFPAPGSERASLADLTPQGGELSPKTIESIRLFDSRVQIARTSLGVLRTELAVGTLPVLSALTNVLGSSTRWFSDQHPILRTLTTSVVVLTLGLGVLGVTIRAVSFATTGLSTGLSVLTGAYNLAATAEGRATVASRAGAVATGIRTAVTAVLSSTLLASVGSWIAATAAAIGFNVASGGVLLAIGAVIGGIVLLIRNWDKVSEAFVSAGRFIGGVFDRIPGPIKTLISVMFPIVGVVRLVVANFDTLRSVAERVFGAIRSVIEPVWNLIMGIGSVLGFVGSLFTGSAAGIPSPLPAGSPGRGTARIGQGEAMQVTNTYNITGVTNPDEVARRVGQSQARSLQVAVEPRAGRRG